MCVFAAPQPLFCYIILCIQKGKRREEQSRAEENGREGTGAVGFSFCFFLSLVYFIDSLSFYRAARRSKASPFPIVIARLIMIPDKQKSLITGKNKTKTKNSYLSSIHLCLVSLFSVFTVPVCLPACVRACLGVLFVVVVVSS